MAADVSRDVGKITSVVSGRDARRLGPAVRIAIVSFRTPHRIDPGLDPGSVTSLITLPSPDAESALEPSLGWTPGAAIAFDSLEIRAPRTKKEWV